MSAYRRFPAWLAALAALGACVPRSAPPAPQPAPPPRPAPPPPPAPSPPPAPAAAWQDGPLTPGDWSYSSATAQAAFASSGGVVFVLRCDAGRRIGLVRPGIAGGPITIVTSFGARDVPGSGDAEQASATLPASDPLFDQIVFSRGRFLIRTVQGGDLVLPSWPEAARLIEECRG